MRVIPIKSPGLAHISYFLHDGGEAAVIDPRLDIEAYLDAARQHDVRITHVFETHRNEDLVSGGKALSERVGAPVHHGTALDFGYGEGAEHGDSFTVGACELTVLHTPGHTDESISIAVRHCSTGDDAIGVFTGDALFVGDVGRTDFYPDRAREVAGLLYDSLHDRILPLGDQAVVWPAHGAGSVCGDGMANRDFSTIGYERANNPRLQLDREAFIEQKLSEEHSKPPYFRRMEELNKAGHDGVAHLPDVLAVGPDGLDDCVLVDVRPAEAWAGNHAAGSFSLPVGMLPAWAGWWLPYDRPLALIADGPEQIEGALQHLTRLGYTNVRSSLRGGLTSWQTAARDIGSAPGISAAELAEQRDGVTVLDVRKPKEWSAGRVPGAVHIPLSELEARTDEVPMDKRVVTFCGSGKRATLAAALLERAGLCDVAICFGSMKAWKALDLPVEEGPS